MNISKFLITSASALAIVGMVGFAVAQTTMSTTPADANPGTQATPSTTPGTMPASPAAQTPPAMNTATPATSSDGSMPTERVAQADRN